MVYIAAAFLASGLIATVSAGNAHAVHRNLHKSGEYGPPPSYSSASPPPAPYYPSPPEDVCTYSTYTKTWYGQPSLVPHTYVPPPPPTYTAPPPPPPTSYEATTSCSETPVTYAPPPPAYTKPAPPPAPYTPNTPSYGTSPPSHGGSGGHGGYGNIPINGDKWAMTYTPYDTNGNCKSASSVMYDIQQVKAKGFTTVRLYATDCSGIENVGAACVATGIKMIMGIWIDAGGLTDAYSQLNELTSWGKTNGWDYVEMVVCGNEAIFNGYVSASQLMGFIGDVKSQFSAAGYSGPVTTTEPVDVIQQYASTICPSVDVIAANIHPFFDGGVAASGAGGFLTSQMSLLSAACGGAKTAYCLETGWPSAGETNGAAVPSVQDQQTAIESIMAAAGAKSALFSYENDSWKAPGAFGVEQYWGCASVFPDN